MTRQEEVVQERRRRTSGTLDRTSQLKLVVPDTVREKFPNDEFRFINDTGNRMHDKTVNDDWTKVDEQLSPKIPVGTDAFNQPIYAHLCRKPRAYVQADSQAMIDATVEQEKGIMRGQQQPSETPLENAYVPGGNSISTGYKP